MHEILNKSMNAFYSSNSLTLLLGCLPSSASKSNFCAASVIFFLLIKPSTFSFFNQKNQPSSHPQSTYYSGSRVASFVWKNDWSSFVTSTIRSYHAHISKHLSSFIHRLHRSWSGHCMTQWCICVKKIFFWVPISCLRKNKCCNTNRYAFYS